jgi:hypothetical protein
MNQSLRWLAAMLAATAVNGNATLNGVDNLPMKLLLSNNQLTRYAGYYSGEYATTTAIPLDGELAVTAQTLLAWLQAQLTEGESVGQVFLEPDGTHSRLRDIGGRRRQRITICDFNPRQAIRRRDRARRRRFTLRCLQQRSLCPPNCGTVCSRHGRQ